MNKKADEVKYTPEKPTTASSTSNSGNDFDPSIAGVLSNGVSIGGVNFLPLLAISLLPLIAGIPLALSIFVTLLFNDTAAVLVVGILISLALLIVTLYLSLWSQAALIKGLVKLIRTGQTKLDLRESLQTGRKYVWSYFVAALALGLLTTAGFILLIIPGLIVMVLFYFVPYVAIDEKQQNVKATFRRARVIMEGNVGTLLLTLLIIFAVASASAWVPFLSFILVPFEAAIFAYMYVAFSETTSQQL